MIKAECLTQAQQDRIETRGGSHCGGFGVPLRAVHECVSMKCHGTMYRIHKKTDKWRCWDCGLQVRIKE